MHVANAYYCFSLRISEGFHCISKINSINLTTQELTKVKLHIPQDWFKIILGSEGNMEQLKILYQLYQKIELNLPAEKARINQKIKQLLQEKYVEKLITIINGEKQWPRERGLPITQTEILSSLSPN